MKPLAVISNLLPYCFLFILTAIPALANEEEKRYNQDYFYKIIDKNSSEISNQLQQELSTDSLSPSEKYFLTHNLAYAHFRLNNKTQALEAFTNSIKLAQELSLYHQAKSYHRRALTYGILLRDTDTAMLDLDSAIALINKSKHSDANELHFDLLTSMSQAYNQKADLINARLYIDKALSLVQLPQDSENKLYALVILGRILWQENNILDATDTYLQALRLTSLNTPKGRIASIELRLAKIYLASNVFEQSLQHAEKAAKIYQEIDQKRLQIKSIQVLGDIHLNLNNDLNKAIMYYLNALDIALEIEAQHFTGELQHLIGAAYILEGNLNSAQKYLDAAEKTLEGSNEKYYSGLNYIEKAKLSHELGDTKAAISILRKLLQGDKLASYPKAEFSAKSKLVSYLQVSQLYQEALTLQYEQINYLNTLLSNNEANNVNVLQKEIAIKSLQTQIETLTQQQIKNKQQITEQTTQQVIFIVVIVLLALGIFYLFYRVKIKENKRFINKQNTHLTWSCFLEKLIAMTKSDKNHVQQKSLNAGLLVSIPNLSIPNKTNSCRLTYNNKIANWHQTLNTLVDSQISSQYLLDQWMYLAEAPIIDDNTLAHLTPALNSVSIALIWFPLSNVPEHFSEDIKVLMEKLIYKASNESNGENTLSLSKIVMQKQSLAIIYSQSNNETFDDKINRAIALGLIRFETQILIK